MYLLYYVALQHSIVGLFVNTPWTISESFPLLCVSIIMILVIYLLFGSDKSSRNSNVRLCGTNLSRALNLHHSKGQRALRLRE